MNKKQIWFLCLFSFCIPYLTSASNTASLELSGTNTGLINQPLNYEAIVTGAEISSTYPIYFHLKGQTTKQETKTIDYTFTQTGSFKLQAELKTPDQNLKAEKKIQIFDKQILYIGEEHETFSFGFEEQLNTAGFLLKKLPPNQAEESETNLAFSLSNILIINEKNFQSYLEKYIAIKKASPTPLSKKIILLTNTNQTLLKRSLAQYASVLENDEISIISPLHFMNLLSDLSLHKAYQEQGYSTTFMRNNESWPKRMFLSYFVDELLKAGFPMQILGILLSLAVLALVISFLRQIVGLSVYGVAWPLLFALTLHLLGFKITLGLLIIAILTHILMRLLNKKLYLLHSSKVSLSICSFLIIFLSGYYRISKAWFQSFLLWKSELLMVFPIILMLLMSEKLFPSFKFWTKQRWIGILEFLIIIAVSYGILEWQIISNSLVSYPELLLVLLIINIIVGRFSGLQLLELIRFMPLIKRHLDQEEEE